MKLTTFITTVVVLFAVAIGWLQYETHDAPHVLHEALICLSTCAAP